MRVSNKTGKWNPSMTEIHNQGFIARNTHIPKNLYVQWRNSDSQRRMLYETREALQELWLDNTAFNAGTFDRALKVSGTCTPNIYYRKMAEAEWLACNSKSNPFKPVFDYHNTDLYRYWMSSSLQKVRAFGNENATDDGDIIVKLTFHADLRNPVGFPLKAHQEPGVQGTPAAIALHREGFVQLGNINNAGQVTEIRTRNLDHNLGFTRKHMLYLAANLFEYSRV